MTAGSRQARADVACAPAWPSPAAAAAAAAPTPPPSPHWARAKLTGQCTPALDNHPARRRCPRSAAARTCRALARPQGALPSPSRPPSPLPPCLLPHPVSAARRTRVPRAPDCLPAPLPQPRRGWQPLSARLPSTRGRAAHPVAWPGRAAERWPSRLRWRRRRGQRWRACARLPGQRNACGGGGGWHGCNARR